MIRAVSMCTHALGNWVIQSASCADFAAVPLQHKKIGGELSVMIPPAIASGTTYYYVYDWGSKNVPILVLAEREINAF